MAALLLEQRRIEADGGERSPLDQLRSELLQVRAEVAALRRDNLELRQQAGYWKGMHARALERLTALEQDNEHLRGEVARLNAQLFGQKSEKQSRTDRSNQLDGLDDEEDDTNLLCHNLTCLIQEQETLRRDVEGLLLTATNTHGGAARAGALCPG